MRTLPLSKTSYIKATLWLTAFCISKVSHLLRYLICKLGYSLLFLVFFSLLFLRHNSSWSIWPRICLGCCRPPCVSVFAAEINGLRHEIIGARQVEKTIPFHRVACIDCSLNAWWLFSHEGEKEIVYKISRSLWRKETN